MPRNSKRKKRKSHYSKGELNRLIDSLLHPLFDYSPAFIIADAFLHGLVEQAPQETVVKFMRYSVPKIIEEVSSRKKND